MPVYLICEIFSKKYIFDKNIQKSGILNIRKKRTKKQQKKGGKEMPGKAMKTDIEEAIREAEEELSPK